MPTYRANVSNNDQNQVEQAEDDSAIRFPWFDGRHEQLGVTKSIKANDMAAQAPSNNGNQDAVRLIPGSGSIIGSHNDHPSRFATPGKA